MSSSFVGTGQVPHRFRACYAFRPANCTITYEDVCAFQFAYGRKAFKSFVNWRPRRGLSGLIDRLIIWSQVFFVCCGICRRVCPWSKPQTVWHRGVAGLATNIPHMRRFLIWADDVIYGKKSRYYPPPEWLQGEEQKSDLSRRFTYWLGHR